MNAAALRKVAEAATPHGGSWLMAEWTEENRAHIATFDPPTILALLDVVEAAKYVRDAAMLTADDAHLTNALEELDVALSRLEQQ